MEYESDLHDIRWLEADEDCWNQWLLSENAFIFTLITMKSDENTTLPQVDGQDLLLQQISSQHFWAHSSSHQRRHAPHVFLGAGGKPGAALLS